MSLFTILSMFLLSLMPLIIFWTLPSAAAFAFCLLLELPLTLISLGCFSKFIVVLSLEK